MKRILLEKVKESVRSIGPVTLVILIISLILGVPGKEVGEFLIGALFLIVGLILFNLGADTSLMTIAEKIGNFITRKKKLILLLVVGFIIGFLATVAEPNLWVLAKQFPAIPFQVLLVASAIGVGFFLVVTLLRITFQMRFSTLILLGYGMVLVFAILSPSEFLPAAFDFGWVITGPLTVPFIMALGLGIASARSDKASEEDSFGLVGLIALGPTLAILLLGNFYPATYEGSASDSSLGAYLLNFILDVAIAILPFIIFFIVFQIIAFKLKKKNVLRIIIGFLYTYIGLVLFLAGANAGFLSIGTILGQKVAGMEITWLLLPIGMIFGFTIAVAEPAVGVLTKQVEEVTAGTLPRKVMNAALSIGVACAAGLACLRILTGIPIWYILLPCYLLIFILSFIVPKNFTPIAFDSGASVSGVMSSSFLIPFANAAAEKTGANVLTDAFGLLAFIAMTPILIVQIIGLIYKFKSKKPVAVEGEDSIIELNEVQHETVDNNS